ncbi:hypothetical protein EV715DRAFT_254130 [Schizophyllum commune]
MATVVPPLGSYQHVQETKENLDWAELVTIDLTTFNTPEGKKELAKQLIKAIREKGFFYVKGFDIPQEKVDRQFALGKQFYELPLEVKQQYTPEGLVVASTQSRASATRRRSTTSRSSPPTSSTTTTLSFRTGSARSRSLLSPSTTRSSTLSTSSSPSLLSSPRTTSPRSTPTSPSLRCEDHFRYMKYGKRSAEENAKIKAWSFGHTDLGSFTLLFRQPVAALQIKDPLTDEWKWVKPQDATITVNSCDALNFLTGGYVRSTIHRVTVPPKDQQHVDRLGLLYFSRPHNDVVLKTITESPVLQREGYTQNDFEKTGNPVPTMEQWTFSKQAWQRSRKNDPKHYTATILPGWQEKIYDKELETVIKNQQAQQISVA